MVYLYTDGHAYPIYFRIILQAAIGFSKGIQLQCILNTHFRRKKGKGFYNKHHRVENVSYYMDIYLFYIFVEYK
jgi:hypothetical protein